MGTRFIFSWFTHDITSSYLEGCNFITAAVSTSSNCMGTRSSFSGVLNHRVLLVVGLLWGLMDIFRFLRFSSVGAFCLWQFEILSCQHQALQLNSIHRSYHHIRFSFHCLSTRSSQLVLRSQLRCIHYIRFLLFLRVS